MRTFRGAPGSRGAADRGGAGVAYGFKADNEITALEG